MPEYLENQVFYPYEDASGRAGYHFWCPGCETLHGVVTSPGGWTFNGDVCKPTISPSVRVRGGEIGCHSFIRKGQIQFLSDCLHKLAGQTVPLVNNRADW